MPRAIATPSAPSTRSAPGPDVESTCTVMPASSIERSRTSPISGSRSSGLTLPGGTFLGTKPRRAIASGLMRRTSEGTV